MPSVDAFTIAVAGNPNAGKTSLFNMLTGSNQTVGNYPGVTVERKEGYVRHNDRRLHMVDLPGTYSLTAYSLEEVVARDFIVEEKPDAVLDVVDASNLERNLYLAMQLMEMERPLVLALNMADIAQQRGIHIDSEAMSQHLGVPVVTTVGHRGTGREELLDCLDALFSGDVQPRPLAVTYGGTTETALADLIAMLKQDEGIVETLPLRWLAVKLLEEDERAAERVKQTAVHAERILERSRELVSRVYQQEGEDPATLIAEHRYGHAAGVVRECVTISDQGTTVTDAIDTIVCSRALGLLVVALVMFVTFKLTFLLADGIPFVPWIGGWTTPVGAFGWIFDDLLPRAGDLLPAGPLQSLLVDGIIAGVGGVMGFVPLIFFMFLLLAFIEDTGYIARIAFVLDRVLRTFGLQGKSILAMIVSGGIAGGCAVPGVMATRTLREEKDRLATMLVAPFMNCGAKMPVFAMLIGAFFSSYKGEMLWFLAALSWLFALSAAYVLRRTVIRGAQTPFVMELPPYHVPSPLNVVRNAFERSWMYMRKAGTVILGVSVLLWAMMYFPRADGSRFEEQEGAVQITLEQQLREAGFPQLAEVDVETLTEWSEHARQGWPDPQIRAQAAAVTGAQPVLDTAFSPGRVRAPTKATPAAAEAIVAAAAQLRQIQNQRNSHQLKVSFAGRIGSALEPVTSLAGFDWKDNVALIGGFAAKEVIVSTMGMAYSMGNDDVPDARAVDKLPLVSALQRDPDWSPLRAFALIIFVMLYAPCLVTVVTIARESGTWKWAAFSVIYSTVIAWVMATFVFRTGLLLGFGT